METRLVRSETCHITLSFDREPPKKDLPQSELGTLCCLGDHARLRMIIREDISPIEPSDPKQGWLKAYKPPHNQGVFEIIKDDLKFSRLDTKSIHCIAPTKELKAFIKQHELDQDNEKNISKVAVIQVKLESSFAHTTGAINIAKLLTLLSISNHHPGPKCVMLGLDAADLIILKRAETVKDLFIYADWIRKITGPADNKDSLQEKDSFQEAIAGTHTTLCFKNLSVFTDADEENEIRSTIRVKFRAYRDSEKIDYNNKAPKKLIDLEEIEDSRTTLGNYDYAITDISLKNLEDKIRKVTGKGPFVTSTILAWNTKNRVGSEGRTGDYALGNRFDCLEAEKTGRTLVPDDFTTRIIEILNKFENKQLRPFLYRLSGHFLA